MMPDRNADTRWPEPVIGLPSPRSVFHSDATRCRKICSEIESLVEDTPRRDIKSKARWLLDMVLYDLPTILDRQYAILKIRDIVPGGKGGPANRRSKRLAEAKECRRAVVSKTSPLIPALTNLAAGRPPTSPIDLVRASLQLKEALERDIEIHESIVGDPDD